MIKAVVYWSEMVLSPMLAVVLVATSTLQPDVIPGLLLGGAIAWTISEYAVHRFVLHDLMLTFHNKHHARPHEIIAEPIWKIWAVFAAVYLVAGGVILAGGLLAYTWYLFVHHCAHHARTALPAALLKHHDGHHRYATRNFGVSTTLWDHVFGTVLR